MCVEMVSTLFVCTNKHLECRRRGVSLPVHPEYISLVPMECTSIQSTLDTTEDMSTTTTTIIHLLLVLTCLCPSTIHGFDSYDHQMFYQRTDPQRYPSWIPPTSEDQIHVNVSIYLNKFGPLDETKSEFSVSMNLYISWHDDRLRLAGAEYRGCACQVSQQMLQRVWRPAIHFSNVNAYTADLLANVTDGGMTTGPYLGVVYSDGRVYVRKRVNLVGVCKVNFMLYPLDVHQCSIQLESSALPIERFQLEWANTDDALVIPEDFTWGNFDLLDYVKMHNLIDYPMTGRYSRIEAIFSLQRKAGYFVLNLYLPSTLIVISSWTSFWIDVAAAPARTTLTMTTMLTHITLTKAVHDTLPKVSYVHTLDVWIIVCTLFIFAAIVEYATANYYYYKQNRASAHQEHNLRKAAAACAEGEADADSIASSQITSSSEHRRWYQEAGKRASRSLDQILSVALPSYDAQRFSPKSQALRIDQVARIVFPVLFIIFNIIYWTMLLCFSSKITS